MKNKFVVVFLGLTSSLFANIQIKSIDIFNNQTLLNQKIDSSKKSVTLLGQIRVEDIKFYLPKECSLNDFGVNYLEFEDDELSIKIEKLKSLINEKQNKIKALNSNISFLEKSSFNSILDSKLLINASSFLKKEIFENHNDIYLIKNELVKLNSSLNELKNRRANSKYTNLNYDLNCSEDVIVSYPTYNISRTGFYDINYDTNSKNLEIKNSSFITQSTGINFKNIDINLYTYSYTTQVKPNKFIPKYLDINENINPRQYAQVEMMMDSASISKMAKVNSNNEPSFEYKEDSIKSFFKASNISLDSGDKKEVVFARDIYKAKQSLEIDGYSLSKAFFKVDFKSEKLYGVLNAKLFLDGTYIGRSYLDEIKKDKESTIYFSTNRFIDINKELIKDFKEEHFFGNKQENQKLWRYEIINNSTLTQNITLLDRVPISKHEDIKIELIGKTKESKIDKNGKIYFDFKLQPKETKVIEFGYEVQRPKKD